MAQLAPDGKIYSVVQSSCDVMHVVDYPDRPGKACQFRQHGLKLPTINLSTIPNNPNYRLGPLDGSPCDTLGIDNLPAAYFRADTAKGSLDVQFIDLSVYEPETWEWAFGDGSTSSEQNPVHTYPHFGTFFVCLIVSNTNGRDTFCREVVLGPSVGVNEARGGIGFAQIFPNPTNDHFQLNYRVQSKGARFHLFSSTGQKTLARTLSGKAGIEAFEVGNLPPGIYFWKIELREGRGPVGKLLVLRK